MQVKYAPDLNLIFSFNTFICKSWLIKLVYNSYLPSYLIGIKNMYPGLLKLFFQTPLLNTRLLQLETPNDEMISPI